MSRTTKTISARRSGPRAPKDKRPLTVIVNAKIIEEAKIAAIRQKTNVSRITDALLTGWLSGKFKIDP